MLLSKVKSISEYFHDNRKATVFYDDYRDMFLVQCIEDQSIEPVITTETFTIRKQAEHFAEDWVMKW